ncbi:MAG: hemerythrin domain-containing protein [Gammaproteobacteria bacterium]
MNILSMLKEEHAEVGTMLDHLDHTTERAIKTRTEVFNQIVALLTIHTEFEEQIFYPRAQEFAKLKDLVLEAYEEHHLVKLLLKELHTLPVEDETWHAKLQVLKENVQHHVEEEEDELFPQLEKLWDDAELEHLAEEYTAFKGRTYRKAA